MDENFITSIQPNSDYLYKPLVWKNELASYVGSNFVAPNFSNLHADSLEMVSDELKTYDGLNCVGDVGPIDFKANNPTQIDYIKNDYVSLTYEKENFQWHIIDAGVSCKSLTDSYNLNDFYTTSQVADEASGNLSRSLPQDNICLQSFTPRDFKEHGNFISVTGPFGDTETVSFQKESNSTTYLACGHVIAGTLTNAATGESITICGDILYSKSTNDFGFAVNGMAFHTSCNVFTEDKCIGYAFAKFNSFHPSNNTFWENSAHLQSFAR